MFGTPAPTTSTSLFGAPAKPAAGGTSLFGQPQKPAAGGASLFGAKPAVGGSSLFGQPQQPAATSLFGAKPATGGTSLFGQPQQPAAGGTSLFGAKPAVGGTSLFGAKPAAGGTSLFGAKPAVGGSSLFGTNTAGTATSLFGAKPAGGTSLFGGAPANSMFGAPAATNAFGAPQTSVQAVPRATAAVDASPAWLRDIYNIRDAYVPGEKCKFQDFVYEVVGVAPDLMYLGSSHLDPRFVAGIKKQRRMALQYQMPWVSKEKWARAEQSNPDRTNWTPSVLVGIDALHNRVGLQAGNTNEQLNMLIGSGGKECAADNWFQSIDTNQTMESLQKCRRRQIQLQQRLIRAMGRLERIELLTAGKSLMESELKFNERLKTLHKSLADPKSCKSQLAQISAEQRTRDALCVGGSQLANEMGLLDDFHKVSTQDEDAIFRFLDEQREGLERLTKILQKDIRDTRIIRERIAAHGGSTLPPRSQNL